MYRRKVAKRGMLWKQKNGKYEKGYKENRLKHLKLYGFMSNNDYSCLKKTLRIMESNNYNCL